MNALFKNLDFNANTAYEKIIDNLLQDGYSISENFFSSTEVETLRQSLLNKHKENAFKKAAIGNKFDEIIVKSIRGDIILWMDETKADVFEFPFFNKINHLVNYLNKTCFLGILHKEFHYALYPKGTFYKRHIDTFQNDGRRKLSFVCYLNEDGWLEENGGELVLYLDKNGQEVEKIIYPFPGRVVIFESQKIEHEVKPVKTERLSITGWLKTR